MLRFFRSSRGMLIVVIILIAGVTWIPALTNLYTPYSGQYGAFLFYELSTWLFILPVTDAWLGLILLFMASFFLVFVNFRLRLIKETSYLPALCYVLFVGGMTELHRMNPALIATILLIGAFKLLVGSFKSDRLSYDFFMASALISAATFFYQYMYVYMLVVWMSLMLWRPVYWREWVFSILGFALPVFFAFSWFFLMDDDYERMGVFFSEIWAVHRIKPTFSIATMLFPAISLLIAAFAFVHLMRNIGSKKTIVSNGYSILILMAIAAVALMITVPDTFPDVWYLLAFPMSFFLSDYLATVKSIRWGTIVLTMLIIGVAIAQIFADRF